MESYLLGLYKKRKRNNWAIKIYYGGLYSIIINPQHTLKSINNNSNEN